MQNKQYVRAVDLTRRTECISKKFEIESRRSPGNELDYIDEYMMYGNG